MMKMKCEIIRDLLPSYVDELTSEESNRVIEEHLKTCAACRSVLNAMKEEVRTNDSVEENKKAIKPFQKLRRRVWKAMGITVVVCVLLLGGLTYHFGHSWEADFSDVKVTYEKVGGVVTLGFLPKQENRYLTVELESKNPDVIVVKEHHVNPLDPPMRKGGYFGYTFLDEETVINSADGSGVKLTGDEVLTIRYGDTTEEIKICDLANEENWKE